MLDIPDAVVSASDLIRIRYLMEPKSATSVFSPASSVRISGPDENIVANGVFIAAIWAGNYRAKMPRIALRHKAFAGRMRGDENGAKIIVFIFVATALFGPDQGEFVRAKMVKIIRLKLLSPAGTDENHLAQFIVIKARNFVATWPRHGLD